MPEIKVAVAWLRQADWDLWQELDPEIPDHAVWLAKVTKAIRHVERIGLHVEKIVIAPQVFGAWCERTATLANGQARSAYAQRQLARRARVPGR